MLVLAFAAAVALVTDPGAARLRACSPKWSVVVDNKIGVLHGVAAVSQRDVWAVGERLKDKGQLQNTPPLIMHWDGSRWAVLEGPPVRGDLFDVDAVSANDVWAVGRFEVGDRYSRTLVLHWNGRSWTVVRTPNFLGSQNELLSVDARSANDVWAVGRFREIPGDHYSESLVQHWNGKRWTVGRSRGLDTRFEGVAAASATSVWAVGWYYEHDYGQLVSHWNGRRWNAVSMRTDLGYSGGNFYNGLYAVAALGADDVWAVGWSGSRPLIEHWNGRSWTIVPSHARGTLNGVVAISRRDVWAVGGHEKRPLIEHWNGRSWRVVPSPRVRATLEDVDAVSSSDLWAVGGYNADPGPDRALIERYGC